MGSIEIFYVQRFFFQNAIAENIPSLMNAIRMIHSISQYYNSSERMTSLFVKITNQMINTCKRYIKNGSSRLWDVPKWEDFIIIDYDRRWTMSSVKKNLHEIVNYSSFSWILTFLKIQSRVRIFWSEYFPLLKIFLSNESQV